MSRRRAVFLDVDGTLVAEGGRIPASAVDAVRQARANGHLVFVCTGRSRAELWPGLFDIGFDGLVGASGAWVEAGGQVLSDRGIPDAALAHALAFFDAHDTDTYLQSDAAIYARPHVKARLQDVTARFGVPADELATGPFGFVDRIVTGPVPADAVISKVIFLACPVPIDGLRDEFAGEFELVPSSLEEFGPGSGEMTAAGLHKAAGLDVLIEHLGIDRADTIAIGDSHNDLELLQHAGVGIAMGNAADDVKAVADEVTSAVDDDGIRAAFLRHALIAEGSA